MTNRPRLFASPASADLDHVDRRASHRRRSRRLGAASLAAGTFLGLGLMLGPVAVANAGGDAPDWQNITTAGELQDAFNNPQAVPGGIVKLGDSVTALQVEGGLSLASGTLSVDLGGHTLTIDGTPGVAGTKDAGDELDGNGGGGATGLEIAGTLYVKSGTVIVTGGAGGNGSDGTESSPGPGNGGKGGVAVSVSGTLVLSSATLNATGGGGGWGGTHYGTGVEGSGGFGGFGGDGTGLLLSSGLIAKSASNIMACDGPSRGVAFRTRSSAFHQQNGDDLCMTPTTVNFASLDANLASVSPSSFDVSATEETTLGKALSVLQGSPLNWPSSEQQPEGWFTAASGGDRVNVTDSLRPNQALYAHWPATGDTGGGNNDSPPPVVVPTTSTTSLAPSTSKAPVSTSPTAPTTKSTAPSPSSSASIPTNNVKDPATFTSSQAPSAPPLPSVSSVDDTSASQFDVNTHTPTQGGELTLVAKGFKPGSVVDFWMHSTPVYLGSAIADVHGIAVLPITLNKSLVGEHHVQSVGIGLLGEPRNLAQPITIAAPPALASTGPVAAAPLTFLAVLLLAGGSALLLADRRRTLAAAHLAGGDGGSDR